MPVTNDEEFKAWLEQESRDVCVSIAFRAALRVLPLATRIREDWSSGSQLALSTFRASLTSGVAVVSRMPDIAVAAADAAANAAEEAGHSAGGVQGAPQAAYAASHAAGAVNSNTAATDAAYATGFVADAANHAGSIDPAAFAAAHSAAYADTSLKSATIMTSEISVPVEVKEAIAAHSERETSFLRAGGPWSFWAKWYDRAMAGDPLPWDLQEQVALIPNEIWEAGPEAVAEEIARIEAEFALRQSIADLEAYKNQPEAKRLGMGGNNPPVEVDDPQTGAQIVIICESVAGLKEEVNAKKPDADRVAHLIDGLTAALRWFGLKFDLAVDTTIKWIIPATGGYLLLNPEQAQAVLQAAHNWLSFLK